MMRLVRNTLILLVAVALVGGLGLRLYRVPAKAPSAASHGHGGEEGHKHGGEGVELTDAKVAAAGIELLKAGPATLRHGITLNGTLQPNQEALVQVTPRFPGIVREIRKRIGDRVEKGEVLIRIESNQSLTVYELRAPIGGTVIDRQVALGEYVSEQKPAMTIVDLSTVWVDFSVPRRDFSRVKVGNTVVLDPDDGASPIEAKISYVSPVGSSDTQSGLARAVVNNSDLRLRPGLFVSGRLLLAEKPVDIAVRLSALQTLENRTVVFVRNGIKFEGRDVELGERDSQQVEVLFGLLEGDVYAAKNSFVIKAELGKGSAAHEH
jgi:cobalt-zinc-cadmium efflux system membrane fusion protein